MKVVVTVKLTDQQLESLRQLGPELEVVRELDPELARQQLREAEVLCCFRLPGPLQEAGKLRWVQLISAGAEHVFEAGIGRTDILVTTVSGIHAFAMAEYALCTMIMMARQMPLILQESGRHQWRPSRPRTYYGEELHGKTLGILGLGAIGRQVGATARCLGMRVLGLRRSGRSEDGGGAADAVYSPEALLTMLGECDYVLIALPLTPETRGLIGERELRSMKPSARLINVGRGEIVDERLLVQALREGWIAGAALDVFSEEPLPAESEMWDLPNLIVTPHISGATLPYMDRAAGIFRENLRRFLVGEPMINVLDKQRGY